MNEGNEATDSVGTGTTTFVSTEVGVGLVIFLPDLGIWDGHGSLRGMKSWDKSSRFGFFFKVFFPPTRQKTTLKM